MHKYRVCVDTKTAIRDFVAAAEKLPFVVRIENEDGKKQGNAKTLFNVVDSISWNKVYVVSDHDIYHHFRDFIINET